MKSKKLIVVNLIGGPGVGKSILASDLFSALKKKQHKLRCILGIH
jgi:DNA replication protein DnaC